MIFSAGKRGFTRFEFAVAASIFALLVAILLNRVQFYQAQADIVAAKQLIGTLRSALQFKMSQLIIAEKQQEIAALIDENPMEWLSETPGNYLGEYYSPNIKDMPAGNWYYDRGRKMLVYLLNPTENFALGPLILLKFKVKSNRLPLNPAQLNGAPALIESVVLDQVID